MNPSEALKTLINNSNLKPSSKKACENALRPAVNKQVPIKVHDNKILSESTAVWLCPICSSYVGKDDNYCSSCGQAIRWE